MEEIVDFDVEYDNIESDAAGSNNIVVDEAKEASDADFTAGDVPVKKKKGKGRLKRKLPSTSTTTTYKSYESPDVDANQLPPFSLFETLDFI